MLVWALSALFVPHSSGCTPQHSNSQVYSQYEQFTDTLMTTNWQVHAFLAQECHCRFFKYLLWQQAELWKQHSDVLLFLQPFSKHHLPQHTRILRQALLLILEQYSGLEWLRCRCNSSNICCSLGHFLISVVRAYAWAVTALMVVSVVPWNYFSLVYIETQRWFTWAHVKGWKMEWPFIMYNPMRAQYDNIENTFQIGLEKIFFLSIHLTSHILIHFNES